MKLKANQPDAFQEQVSVPGTIQVLSLVTRAEKLRRVLEMGDKGDLSMSHFITCHVKTWQAQEISGLVFFEKGQVGTLLCDVKPSVPSVFHIWSLRKVYLHNKTTHLTIPGDFMVRIPQLSPPVPGDGQNLALYPLRNERINK